MKNTLKILPLLAAMASSALADQRGSIVIDTFADLGNKAFPPDTTFRYSKWSNTTGQTVYIHSAELKMYTEMNDQGSMSSGAELMLSSSDPTRNGSYVLWGSLYCVVTDPTIVAKTFDPDPIVIMPGEGLVLRYYASYPNLASQSFFDGVIIWYSVGTP